MPEPVLYSERERRRERDAREATGESLWTGEFSQVVRWKISYAARDAIAKNNDAKALMPYEKEATALILRANGWSQLFVSDGSGQVRPASGFQDYWLNASDIEYLDAVEALYYGLRRTFGTLKGRDFAQTINEILREHRVSFELVDARMIPIESQEMHAAVVRPTITLLSERPEFHAVEEAYLKALDEISKNDPGDAITDAGTALQQTLEALGCTGNNLGRLIPDAKRRGLLLAHDSTLTDGIEKILNWVSADRSQSGDAHKATDASVEDAWLIVHVVGALILRLAGGPTRGVDANQ